MKDKKPQEEEIRLPNSVWGWASSPTQVIIWLVTLGSLQHIIFKRSYFETDAHTYKIHQSTSTTLPFTLFIIFLWVSLIPTKVRYSARLFFGYISPIHSPLLFIPVNSHLQKPQLVCCMRQSFIISRVFGRFWTLYVYKIASCCLLKEYIYTGGANKLRLEVFLSTW